MGNLPDKGFTRGRINVKRSGLMSPWKQRNHIFDNWILPLDSDLMVRTQSTEHPNS